MADTDSKLNEYYTEAFCRLAPRQETPEIEARFYPYVGLNHTIRRRGGRVYVRVSDMTREAPPEVQQALAFVLVAKLLRLKIPPAPAALYREYSRRPNLVLTAEGRRRESGRKFVTSPQGRFYNLELLFKRLNRRYFAGALPTRTLTWSQRETSRIFGHHDGAHETIVISRTLDSPDVPEFVVEFVLYHEMLHVKHPVRVVNGRRSIHSAAFRADEKLFPQYKLAQEHLEHLAQAQHRNSAGLARRAKNLVKKLKLF